MGSTENYVNFHTHTHFSLLDGHARPDRLVARAAELGMPALGFTDHGNIHGWLDFWEAGKKHGVKPVLGLEAYQARKTRFDRDEEERAGRANDELVQRGPYHLTVLARNMAGYKNLIKLSSRAYLEGYYGKPRIDHDLLSQHAEGLIVLSGCLNGEVQQAILRGDGRYAYQAASRIQEIVGPDNFFVEIQDHGLREQAQVRDELLEIARRLKAPVIPTGDCHYVLNSDAHTHDLMLCVSTKATVSTEGRFRFSKDDELNPQFYLKSYDEMRQLFPVEWLQNSLDLASRVDLDLPFGELYFPHFSVPVGETVDSFLEKQMWAGLIDRYGDPLSREVRERAEYELGIVRRMRFQTYFLVVSDLVQWARSRNIRVGWGRGSGAGSVISYALQITNLDPMRFDLLFERFLVEGRKTMPDIDLDFDDRYRDQVVDYARQRYGTDHVANICTFSSVGARAAVRDAARVLGYDYQTGDKLAKLLPPVVLGKAKSIEESLKTPEFKKVYETDVDAHKIIDAAKGLEGLPRQTGIHPSGVIITPEPVINYIPIMQKGEGEPIVTQWDMYRVEETGILKIDFLALRNLSVLDICVDNIRERQGIEIDVNEIDIDNTDTYQELCAGSTVGVFQLESAGMREMIRSIRPNKIEDIMNILSLYRPGALGSGADKLYVDRKHGRKRVEYPHPRLAPVLEKSYGIMLYQEDVLNVAMVLAGFSVSEADDLRKAIGKKEIDKIGLYRDKFVEGCAKTSNVPRDVADKIYSDIEYFGGYGFNLAHAASYAMLSFVTAYLKKHYPVEYMAALLSSVDEKKKTALYLNECRRMGVEVLPPSIQKSRENFSVLSDHQILFGLLSVSGLGPAIVGQIVSGRRDFSTLYDFMRKAPVEVLSKQTLEHLVASGALDELAPTQSSRLLPREEHLELLNLEKEELGTYVSDHPLIGVAHLLEPLADSTVEGLEVKEAGALVRVAGLLYQVHKRTTKNNSIMYKLVLEDLTGSIEVLVFPREAMRMGDDLHEGEVVVIEARLQKEGEEENPTLKLFFVSLTKPQFPTFGVGQPIVLELDYPPSDDTIEHIEALIEDNPGDNPVIMRFPVENSILGFRFKKPTDASLEEKLKLIILKENSNV